MPSPEYKTSPNQKFNTVNILIQLQKKYNLIE